MEDNILKIRTHKGRIITLEVTKKTYYDDGSVQFTGKDKFDEDVIICSDEIASLHILK